VRVRAAANVGLAGWLVLVALVLAAPLARAEPPARLGTQVVDRAGVLGDRVGAVQDAVDALAQERNVSLFVVFVRTFGGVPARQWADQTAAASDLGLNDIVLAVAVDDRAYAYSVDNQFPISDDDLAAVATQDIEPRLRDGDWAGAAVGAARAYADVLAAGGGSGDGSGGGTTDGSTGGGTTSTTQRSSAARLVVPALVVGGLVVGGLALVGSWLVMAVTTRYSSLSAITVSVLAPVYVWVFTRNPALILATGIMALLLLWRHRSNIQKLLAGTETKIGQ